jgi:hypothetical protein
MRTWPQATLSIRNHLLHSRQPPCKRTPCRTRKPTAATINPHPTTQQVAHHAHSSCFLQPAPAAIAHGAAHLPALHGLKLAPHHSLQIRQALAAVHHQAHEVRAVVLPVEVHHCLADIQALCLRDGPQCLQVACRVKGGRVLSAGMYCASPWRSALVLRPSCGQVSALNSEHYCVMLMGVH